MKVVHLLLEEETDGKKTMGSYILIMAEVVIHLAILYIIKHSQITVLYKENVGNKGFLAHKYSTASPFWSAICQANAVSVIRGA